MAVRPVSASTSFASASQLSSLRLAITTSAPASANALTIDRPRPRLPPVTTATLPVRSNNSSGRPLVSPLRELAGRAPGSCRSCERLRDRHPLLRQGAGGLHRRVGDVPPLGDHEAE